MPLFAPLTPEWYAYAEHNDTALNINPRCMYVTGCTRWVSGGWANAETTRKQYEAAGSYVTGTHNIKIGFQNTFGPVEYNTQRSAGLAQNYVNHVPQTVTVYNTPVQDMGHVDKDLGIYAQDSWTIGKLTLNPGLRVEWFQSGMRETVSQQGRFAPARFFEAQPNLPNWGPDYAPRFSAAYDLFGNGKTALKASASKYHAQFTRGYFNRYANAAVFSESRNWFDVDLIPGTSTRSGIAKPTDNDDIAQDNEIGPSASANFGSRSDRNPAPDLRRVFNWEYTASVQHQLIPNVSVTGAYYHRKFDGLEVTDRANITLADYTSFTLPMPSFANDPRLSGVLNPNEILTIYNLLSSKRSVYGVGLVDRNSDDTSIYDAFEASFQARLRRTTVFGGWIMERNLSVFCSSNDDPNGVNASDLYMGDRVSNGGRFCDMREFDVPFRHQFKLSGSYTLPFALDFGAVLQSYPGSPRVITWQPVASLFPGGRTNSETIILTRPGQLYQPRYNELDINFKKNFRSGRKRFSLQVDFFNVLNGNAIFATTDAIGASLGNVQTILMGRMPRIAFQAVVGGGLERVRAGLVPARVPRAAC